VSVKKNEDRISWQTRSFLFHQKRNFLIGFFFGKQGQGNCKKNGVFSVIIVIFENQQVFLVKN